MHLTPIITKKNIYITKDKHTFIMSKRINSFDRRIVYRVQKQKKETIRWMGDDLVRKLVRDNEGETRSRIRAKELAFGCSVGEAATTRFFPICFRNFRSLLNGFTLEFSTWTSRFDLDSTDCVRQQSCVEKRVMAFKEGIVSTAICIRMVRVPLSQLNEFVND